MGNKKDGSCGVQKPSLTDSVGVFCPCLLNGSRFILGWKYRYEGPFPAKPAAKNDKYKDDIQERTIIINQIIGGQSVILRLFKRILQEEDNNINRLEITYFTLSVFAYLYLRLTDREDAESLLDDVSMEVINKNLPYAGQSISKQEIINEYQYRYKEYNEIIQQSFQSQGSLQNTSQLTEHLYKCVTQKKISSKQLLLEFANPIIAQFIADNIDFIKKYSLQRKAYKLK